MRKIHFASIDSTNTFAKRLAGSSEHDQNETVLITADEQTAGRGRTGKSFDSRKGNGLYMTVLFPVGKPPEACLFITVAAAVAVCTVLRRYSGEDIRIKWVNDLYLSDRKVCGILAEAVTDAGSGIMNSCVLGVGVNLDTKPENYPEELRPKVGSVNGIPISKECLAAKIAEETVRLIQRALENERDREAVLSEYRSLSMILGREVFWEENGRNMEGKAVDIDGKARLVVETAGGIKQLDSGYVSVKF